jgi:hypothetical protein
MNNDVMMMNKEHKKFQFTQLNNNVKDSKTIIYLLILLAISYLSISLME